MVKDLRVEVRAITDETGAVGELRYYVRIFNMAYGIKIELCTSEGIVFSEETCELTYSYDDAEGWVKKLASGRVTPMSLHDMADEFVG